MMFFNLIRRKRKVRKIFKKLRYDSDFLVNKNFRIIKNELLNFRFANSLIIQFNQPIVENKHSENRVFTRKYWLTLELLRSRDSKELLLATLPKHTYPQSSLFIDRPKEFRLPSTMFWHKSIPIESLDENGLFDFLEDVIIALAGTSKKNDRKTRLATDLIKKKDSPKNFKVKKSTSITTKTREFNSKWLQINDGRSLYPGSRSEGYLFLEPNAQSQLATHIGWGNPGADNIIEQGGLLIGETFINTEGLYWGLVKSTIPSVHAKGTPGSLHMNHEDWRIMLDNYDVQNSDGYVLGWYHTHPNQLDVFMSGVDMVTQQSMFSEDWHFAMVLNPHRRIWRVYRGNNAAPCQGYFLSTNKLSEDELS